MTKFVIRAALCFDTSNFASCVWVEATDGVNTDLCCSSHPSGAKVDFPNRNKHPPCRPFLLFPLHRTLLITPVLTFHAPVSSIFIRCGESHTV